MISTSHIYYSNGSIKTFIHTLGKKIKDLEEKSRKKADNKDNETA